jgi:hypothetical protein
MIYHDDPLGLRVSLFLDKPWQTHILFPLSSSTEHIWASDWAAGAEEAVRVPQEWSCGGVAPEGMGFWVWECGINATTPRSSPQFGKEDAKIMVNGWGSLCWVTLLDTLIFLLGKVYDTSILPMQRVASIPDSEQPQDHQKWPGGVLWRSLVASCGICRLVWKWNPLIYGKLFNRENSGKQITTDGDKGCILFSGETT